MMSKFSSIHVSDIDGFISWLICFSFKKKPKRRSEIERWEHPSLGKVILWDKKNSPYRAINDNGFKLFKDYEKENE